MNIVLSKNVLSSEQEAVHQDLTRLLSLLEQSTHSLCLDEAVDIRESSWYQGEGLRTKRRILNLFSQAGGAGGAKDRLTLLISEQPVPSSTALSMALSLSASLGFLEAPVHIVVELAMSDKAFVAELLRRFALDLLAEGNVDFQERLRTCVSNPSAQSKPIQFTSGGGSTTKLVVNDLLNAQIPARVLVVVDRDVRLKARARSGPDPDLAGNARAHTNGQTPLPSGETGKAVFGIAPSPRLRRHCLVRREQENYLPMVVLERFSLRPPGDSLLGAFKCLNDDAQHYWDMKEGIKSSLTEEVVKSLKSADLQSIGRALDDDKSWKNSDEALYWKGQASEALLPRGYSLADLYHGFGPKVAELWSRPFIEQLADAEFSEEVRKEARLIAMKLRWLL